jgi:hypothetical protein
MTKHELSLDANDAVAETAELPITARVGRAAARVIATINLNEETDCGSEEIYDEAAAEQHLRAELHAQLTGFERRP